MPTWFLLSTTTAKVKPFTDVSICVSSSSSASSITKSNSSRSPISSLHLNNCWSNNFNNFKAWSNKEDNTNKAELIPKERVNTFSAITNNLSISL